MQIKELFETYLPLRRGAMRHARTSYGALVVVMSPTDFLKLTTTEDTYNQFFRDYVSLKQFKLGGRDYGYDQYNMPWLSIGFPDGRVDAHEGRHRAAMITRAGGEKFPVLIYFSSPIEWQLSYRMTNRDDDATKLVSKSFATKEEAYAAKQALEDSNNTNQSSEFYSRIRVHTAGNEKLRRGLADERWTTDDLPKQLIGQYDRSMVVPTAGMKVGVVKR